MYSIHPLISSCFFLFRVTRVCWCTSQPSGTVHHNSHMQYVKVSSPGVDLIIKYPFKMILNVSEWGQQNMYFIVCLLGERYNKRWASISSGVVFT